MKRLITALLFSVALTATLAGCPSVPTEGQTVVLPKGDTQSVYALEVSLTTATNALADLHNAGIVVGANYAAAYDIEKRAHATLLEARKAAMTKDATRAQVLLHTLNALIDQLATYNGGKR